MSASNNRVSTFSTYHHLMSRIAHQVYFLTEDVRNDFIEMIRRSAEFHGIKLIAWCIMTNHFHLLAYLPEPEVLTEAEVIRRFGILNGETRRKALVEKLESLRSKSPADEVGVQLELAKITNRMYKIGEFMKVIKQWLTQEYNSRYTHVGTLWDSVYKDVAVPGNHRKLAERAAYIHLNPVRAAITAEFADYRWSSLTALKNGDEMAIAGLRDIYGDECSAEEILESHTRLMSELLEQCKYERANEIARRRRAGFSVEADNLTTEAMIAQASAQLEAGMSAVVEDDTIKRAQRGRPSNDERNGRIVQMARNNPELSVYAIAEAVGCSIPTVYRILKSYRK